MSLTPEAIQCMTYADALAALTADPNTTYMLRQRMREDSERDVNEARCDAQLLAALLERRAVDERNAQPG
ncbi:hypothetical protein HLB44_30925 [Aquincola sp. S2]|uniref:Uncharacterized protein n=1 Tax=Pseudaquabacterium terrae TaxID=2732868 RepID=A0ABX2ES27_9BURK|nr:hypothetical protein [Aquabacterium terrae]NRF71408.1 hypothetical protein [Aquabacterium terrae]